VVLVRAAAARTMPDASRTTIWDGRVAALGAANCALTATNRGSIVAAAPE